MRQKIISTVGFSLSCFLLALCLVQPCRAFWWGRYPECAQTELEKNGPKECDISSAVGVKCLCGNSGFLSGSAKDIWQKCGCAVLQRSAATASTICQEFGFPIALNRTEMVAAGTGGRLPCTNPSHVPSPDLGDDGTGANSKAPLPLLVWFVIGIVFLCFVVFTGSEFRKRQQLEKQSKIQYLELQQQRDELEQHRDELEQHREWNRWESWREQLQPSYSDADGAPTHTSTHLGSQTEGSIRLD